MLRRTQTVIGTVLGVGLWLLIGAGLMGLSLVSVGCGSRSLGESPVVPLPGAATDITLEIYSDGLGMLVETRTLPSEGAVIIDPAEDQPFSEPPAYYVFARADGYFTEVYLAQWGDTIDVDLDAVPDLPNGMAGVVFHGDTLNAPCYYDHESVAFGRPDVDGSLQYAYDLPFLFQETDRQGRYGLSGLDLGDWLLVFTASDVEQVFPLENTAGTDYRDIVFFDEMYARAPNLYLYPEAETDVRVTLGFPQGGRVVASEPPYGDGWQVHITPDGVVDGRYPYLFYEAALPWRVQTRQGWVLPGDDLEGGLRSLLGGLGFAGREIDDFVQYWVPLLEGEAAWALYPQDADALAPVAIQPPPARLRRLWLLARPLSQVQPLLAPAPWPTFERQGYYGLEWGMILAR